MKAKFYKVKKMKKEFYLFRHGKTDYNEKGLRQGCTIDVGLNNDGIEQAYSLIPILKSKGIEIIYTSHLKRAYQTAEIVAKSLDINFEVISDLREGNLGITEGKTKSEIKELCSEEFLQNWNSREDCYLDMRIPEGESKREIMDRMFAVLETLIDTNENVIGIASHQGAIIYLLRKFGLKPMEIPNSALFHIVYDDGNWSAEIL